jgi:hypothetical protein
MRHENIGLLIVCGVFVFFTKYAEGDVLRIDMEMQTYPAITVAAENASNILVEVSQNLNEWSPLVNIYTTTSHGFYRDLDASVDKRRYYRARMPGISNKEMRNLWKSQGIDNYSYEFKRTCFCEPHITLTATVNVQNGTIQSVTNVKGQGGLPVEDPDLEEFKSIDELFAVLQMQIGSAEVVKVKYDTTNGYPLRLQVDPALEIIDDEITYEVNDMVENRDMRVIE